MTSENLFDVQITITANEAIVLFEILQRFSNTDKLVIEDQAEERALWNLCCVFEKNLLASFDKEYTGLLQEARDRLRDEP
jgi:hypothetical protein